MRGKLFLSCLLLCAEPLSLFSFHSFAFTFHFVFFGVCDCYIKPTHLLAVVTVFICWILIFHGLLWFRPSTTLCWITHVFPHQGTTVSVWVPNYWLYHIWTGYVYGFSVIGVCSRFWIRSCGCLPTFCMSQLWEGIKFGLPATKEDVYSHILFLQYTNLIPLVILLTSVHPHIVVFLRASSSSCLRAKNRMRVMPPSPPLVVKIWVRSVWTLFMFFKSSNFDRESDRLRPPPKI